MTSLLELQEPSLLSSQNFVNGEWKVSVSGRTFSVTDPASCERLGTSQESDTTDLEHAIKAASSALPGWRNLSGRERSRILRKWFELVVEHKDDLAKIISAENGKAQPDAAGEVMMAAGFLEWFAEEAARVYGDVAPHSNSSFRLSILKEPVGVCGMITPWNFPAAMVTRKLAPCLAAGCTAVLKPDGLTPYTASAFVVLAQRAGVPAGVINVVNALDNTPALGKMLCESLAVRKLSFTGSTRVGKILLSQSASNVQKLSLELGGNAPFIVLDDADLSVAAASLIACKFKVSGQTCVCANRIYVHESVHDAFVEKVVALVKQFKVGPSSDPKTTQGPLIHAAAVAKCKEHVDDAISKGAQAKIGGGASQQGPNFFTPTVLINANDSMKLAHEETFGPVAAIFKFSHDAEVVKAANDTTVGLASYLMTKDANRARQIAESLQAGMVAVNTGVIADQAAPFGGVMHSGFGRESSKYGIEGYLTLKTVVTGGCSALL